MSARLALLCEAVVICWPVRRTLLRARWVSVAPRAAILTWQAVGFALAVAALGGCLSVAAPSVAGGPSRALTILVRGLFSDNVTRSMTPNELFGFTAGLIVATVFGGSLLVRSVGLVRASARCRILVDLVGEERAEVPGALVVEHATPTAYCLPGRHPRIVFSSAAVATLSTPELDAVLAHERAHLTARHDLVLLPFRAVVGALPGSRAAERALETVGALVELAADDRAMRDCDRSALARALCRLTAGAFPAGAIGAAGHTTVARVDRALAGQRGSWRVALGASLASVMVVAIPLATVVAALGGR